jgi:hypothetical protein
MPPSLNDPLARGSGQARRPVKSGRAEEHLEEAMKLGIVVTAVALATATTFGGGAVAPVDAGDKGSKKRVHISPGVSTKNLSRLEKQLKGSNKRAVQDEIKRRGTVHHEKRLKEQAASGLGRALISGPGGDDPIIGLWGLGVELGTRRKGGH